MAGSPKAARILSRVVDDRQGQRGERRRRPAPGGWSGPGRARPVQPRSAAGSDTQGDRAPHDAGSGPPIPPGVEAKQLAPEIRRELSSLDEATLAAALREASVAELKPGAPDGIVDLLVASGLSDSKKAARRTIGEGGVSVNNVRIESDEWVPQSSDFLHGRWLVLRRGKRNIAGIEKV